VVVDTVLSDQAPGYKFGGVNALLGGVDHLAVDPGNGDVYVTYGSDTRGSGVGNQLLVRRIQAGGSGGVTIGNPTTLSSATSVAMPSIAVGSDGTVGVLYDTFNGTAADGFPGFSAHLSRSGDHGASFVDQTLLSFESPAQDNGNARQRVLGDYQRMTAVGTSFYGAFSGNRAAFGGTISATDPVFFSASPASLPAPAPSISVSGSLAFGMVAANSTTTRTLTVANSGTATLRVSGLGFTAGGDPGFSVVGPAAPFSVAPHASATVSVAFAAGSAAGATHNGTLAISSDDPSSPTLTVAASATVSGSAAPRISAPGSLNFGSVRRGHSSTLSLVVGNSGTAPLTISGIGFSPGSDPGFSVSGTTPRTVAPNGSVTFRVRFAPASNTKAPSGTLVITSNDPVRPTVNVATNAVTRGGRLGMAGSTSFGSVTEGTRASRTLVLFNQGDAPLVITGIGFVPRSDAAFSVAAPATPLTLAPGQQVTVTVTFSPAISSPRGTRTASLAVSTDDPLTPEVDVAGSGRAT
jgi:hypothetical protein